MKNKLVLATFTIFALLFTVSGAIALTSVYDNSTKITGSDWGSLKYTNWNMSNRTYAIFNVTYQIPGGVVNGAKTYFNSTGSGDGAYDQFWEWQSGTSNFCSKYEPTYAVSICSLSGNNVSIQHRINKTAGTYVMCLGDGSSCQSAQSFGASLPNDSMISFSWGSSGSVTNITRIQIIVLDNEINGSGSGGGGGAATYTAIYPYMNASTTGQWTPNSSMNRSDVYDRAVYAPYLQTNTSQRIIDVTPDGRLFVYWYDSSSDNSASHLKSNPTTCPAPSYTGCREMVSDELSGYGQQLAKGSNQTRFNQFVKTVRNITNSTTGLPSWGVVINSDNSTNICPSGLNGNCDDASDANARIIIALNEAANNTLFTNQTEKTDYAALADNITAAFYTHDFRNVCLPSSIGVGNICLWQASGKGAKTGGFASTDYGYTGYAPDSIIAFAGTYARTGNLTYKAAVGNVSAAYLEMSKWNGITFTVPPGRSWKILNTSAGQVPYPVCTNTCSPDQFDGSDAVREAKLGAALYYANMTGISLPNLTAYVRQQFDRYYNTTSNPTQFYTNGTNSNSPSSGYTYTGLAAYLAMGLFNNTYPTRNMDSCMNHMTNNYNFDNELAAGIYTHEWCINAYGNGIGRNNRSYYVPSSTSGGGGSFSYPITLLYQNISPNPVTSGDDPWGVVQLASNVTGDIVVTYSWYINNTFNFSGTYTVQNGVQTSISQIDHALLRKGVNVTFQVEAADADQNTVTPGNITLTVQNSIPSLQTVEVRKVTDGLYTCYYVATDSDSDTLSVLNYSWYKNDVFQNLNTTTIDTSAMSSSDVIKCAVNVTDGTASTRLLSEGSSPTATGGSPSPGTGNPQPSPPTIPPTVQPPVSHGIDVTKILKELWENMVLRIIAIGAIVYFVFIKKHPPKGVSTFKG